MHTLYFMEALFANPSQPQATWWRCCQEGHATEELAQEHMDQQLRPDEIWKSRKVKRDVP